MERETYPSDVSDDEWSFIPPDLTLMKEDAPQREYDLREVFNGLRWIVRTGAQWRMMPHDLPPWAAVYQQTQRWLKAGVFEAIVDDLRALLRMAQGRNEEPSAAIFDSRTLQSSPESGHRAGYDGAKRRKGSKVHLAVDTLGHLLSLHVTAANEQDRTQVAQLAAACICYSQRGSYAVCVVPESAPYGKIEASTVPPLLPFECYFHVAICFILAVCRSVSR